LFDLVHVPSRFVGTENYLNPAMFAQPMPSAIGEAALVSFYHPPFNKVSEYREPGRININTIPSDPALPVMTGSTVWSGVINGASINGAPLPRWDQVIAGRRGETINGKQATDAQTNTVPSVFYNPFRGAAGSNLMLPSDYLSSLYSGGAAPIEADVTLLRRQQFNAPTSIPLFSKLVNPQPTERYSDGIRHAYFSHQPLIRSAGVLTTHSNVYAVWITVGYFEVMPAPNDNSLSPARINYFIYPDGYQLGQELGADTGEIVRHRAFYIYDRSIPVCFEPGMDHNYDKGILLKRFIE
jgi:hypothetical protein